MGKYLLLIFFFLPIKYLSAENIRVGILAEKQITALNFIPANAVYFIFGNQKKIATLQAGEALQFRLSQNYITVVHDKKFLGKFKKIKCVAINMDGYFRVKPLKPDSDVLPYEDQLELTPQKKHIRLVNVVDLEKYVASVMESEIGDNHNEEFLKVQAVICRTYVMSALDRHRDDGYNVCDRVHCQVYNCKSRFNDAIIHAVDSTRGLLLADKNEKLITVYFSSNCGGQTSDSKDVWGQSLPCIQSVADSFCICSPHAIWNTKIKTDDWKKYLHSKRIVFSDSLISDSSFNFIAAARVVNYSFAGQNLSLRNIRDEWKLKSTWFSVSSLSDSLLFSGRGFGHGVGLCQEGAMQMGELCFNFEEIINFYFKDVMLIDAGTLKFLNEK